MAQAEEERSTQIMLALELLAERAYREDDPLTFAIVDEAGVQAGFPSPNIVNMVTGERMDTVLLYLENSRYRRNRKLLRAKAAGMLAALHVLFDAGALVSGNCSDARWSMWKERTRVRS